MTSPPPFFITFCRILRYVFLSVFSMYAVFFVFFLFHFLFMQIMWWSMGEVEKGFGVGYVPYLLTFIAFSPIILLVWYVVRLIKKNILSQKHILITTTSSVAFMICYLILSSVYREISPLYLSDILSKLLK